MVSFRVVEAQGVPSALVVEVPHAAIAVDPACMPWLVAPVRSIGRDADLYVDELFREAPSLGATLVSAELSRYVCDLNRDIEDIDAESVEGGAGADSPHGLIWHRSTDGHRALPCPVPAHELRRRLNEYYYPYHRTIRRLLEERRRDFGYAILLCAHSMPSRGRVGSVDVGRKRADIVPGSRGRTSAARAIIDCAEELANRSGWTVAHDDPYRGGFATLHYGKPDHGWHALQVEISRARYMDETSLLRHSGYNQTQEFCNALVQELVSLRL
jgi:N-formylglutamate amidohydrolase